MDIELLTLSKTVSGVDAKLPVGGVVRRCLHTFTRDEYWLVELETPIAYADRAGAIRYLLLWPEPGEGLAPETEMTCTTGVDIVLDESLLNADFVEFGKCLPIGVGRMLVRPATINALPAGHRQTAAANDR